MFLFFFDSSICRCSSSIECFSSSFCSSWGAQSSLIVLIFIVASSSWAFIEGFRSPRSRVGYFGIAFPFLIVYDLSSFGWGEEDPCSVLWFPSLLVGALGLPCSVIFKFVCILGHGTFFGAGFLSGQLLDRHMSHSSAIWANFVRVFILISCILVVPS